MSVPQRLRAYVHRAVFEQNEPLRRLALVRICLGLVCLAYLAVMKIQMLKQEGLS